MELLSFVILMAIAGALVAYSLVPRRAKAEETIKRRLAGRKQLDPTQDIRVQARKQARESIVKKATPMLSRLVMPVSDQEQSLLRIKLMQAGYRHPQAQMIFLASKTACMVVGLLAGAVIGPSLGYDFKTTAAVAMLAGGIGFLAPGFWLDSMIRSRQKKIRKGLPDILDLLVVSVESGLALDAAIKRVGEEMAMVHPEISEEFRIATVESQMGIPRSEALENMANRTGIEEVRSLVSVITQAERFGTSVAKALRNQGDALRVKRRQQAEEKAQKTAVKLMIPLVLFIFPAMGVVLAGPAAIRVMEAFAE